MFIVEKLENKGKQKFRKAKIFAFSQVKKITLKLLESFGNSSADVYPSTHVVIDNYFHLSL